MAGEFKIEVFKRELTKKGRMKAFRKEDKIPGIYYSHNSTNSVPLYITKNTFKEAQKSGSRIFNILVGDKKRNVIFKFIQYHPVTDEVLHLDLYGVDMNRPVAISIIVALTGTAKGVSQEGGVLVQSLNEVNIESKVGFAYSLELLAKCNRLKYKITEIPAQWEERSEGSSRFKVFKWLPQYLNWYLYGLGTTWLKKGPQDVKKRL